MEHFDVVELEKALRYVEKRRGELLGSNVTQGRRTDLTSPSLEKCDESEGAKARYRQIARHWDKWLYPHLLKADDHSNVRP